jgi:hypothetical protein
MELKSFDHFLRFILAQPIRKFALKRQELLLDKPFLLKISYIRNI